MAVTIKDVAKAAGTSTATVSKVLSGSPTISQATAERVQKVVRELHYLPNARAQNFAQRRTRTVYFLAKLERNTAFVNPHLFEILSGAQAMLDTKQYSLCLKSLDARDACAFVEQLTAQKGADGILLHASVASKKLANILSQSAFPHLLIGRPNFESTLCWIDTNNQLSGELAARHLLSLGFSDIAFIGGKPDDMISWHRLRGVRQVLEEQHILFGPGRVKQVDSTFHDGYRAARQMTRGTSIPRAIVCANNLIALGCMQALRDRGIAVPQTVAVITFDNYPYSTITDPRMTVVDINMYDMGKQAAQWLLDKINKPNLQIQAYTTLPELVVWGSTVATPRADQADKDKAHNNTKA